MLEAHAEPGGTEGLQRGRGEESGDGERNPLDMRGQSETLLNSETDIAFHSDVKIKTKNHH